VSAGKTRARGGKRETAGPDRAGGRTNRSLRIVLAINPLTQRSTDEKSAMRLLPSSAKKAAGDHRSARPTTTTPPKRCGCLSRAASCTAGRTQSEQDPRAASLPRAGFAVRTPAGPPLHNFVGNHGEPPQDARPLCPRWRCCLVVVVGLADGGHQRLFLALGRQEGRHGAFSFCGSLVSGFIASTILKDPICSPRGPILVPRSAYSSGASFPADTR